MARDAGALVVLDVKRGDIGSTMAAYADAYLAPEAPLAVDAITLNPYLGVGCAGAGLRAHARGTRSGCSSSALTSNPEGPQMQHATVADGRTVAQLVVDELADRNVGAEPFGSLGIVVGATIGTAAVDLRGLHGPVLMPGVGAARAARRRTCGASRARCSPAVVPSVSREVLAPRPGRQVAAGRGAPLIDAFAFLRA